MILKAPEDIGCTVCIWCDTETGEAVHLRRDSGGVLSRRIDEDGMERYVTEWRQHAAPMTFVRHAQGVQG